MKLFSFIRRSCCEALNHKEEKSKEVDFTSHEEEKKKEVLEPQVSTQRKNIYTFAQDGLHNDQKFMTTDHRNQKSEDHTSLLSRNSQKKGLVTPFFEYAIVPRKKKEEHKIEKVNIIIPSEKSSQIMKMLRNIY